MNIYEGDMDMDSEILKQRCEKLTLEDFEKYVEKCRVTLPPYDFAVQELEIQKKDLEKAKEKMLGNLAVFRLHFIKVIEQYIKEKCEQPEQGNKNLVKEIKPIVWKGTQGQLIYLFEKLQEKKFLPIEMDLQSTIKKHFTDSEGKFYTNLKQAKQDYLENKTSKPKGSNDIDSLINEVLNQS
jgi:hypothetical protein